MNDSWHAYFAEALGTLVFVFVAAAVVLTQQQSRLFTTEGVALATGFALAAVVYSTAHISGGHVNPAVTITMWATGKMKAMTALGYVVAQLVGAVIAALFVKVMFEGVVSPQYFLGDAMLGQGVSVGKAIFLEAIMTFVLVWTFFATVIDKRAGHNFGPLIMGLVLATAVIVIGPYTSAALNPARSFGPALVSSHWTVHFVYWIGPLIGSLLAGFGYSYGFLKKE